METMTLKKQQKEITLDIVFFPPPGRGCSLFAGLRTDGNHVGVLPCQDPQNQRGGRHPKNPPAASGLHRDLRPGESRRPVPPAYKVAAGKDENLPVRKSTTIVSFSAPFWGGRDGTQAGFRQWIQQGSSPSGIPETHPHKHKSPFIVSVSSLRVI